MDLVFVVDQLEFELIAEQIELRLIRSCVHTHNYSGVELFEPQQNRVLSIVNNLELLLERLVNTAQIGDFQERL